MSGKLAATAGLAVWLFALAAVFALSLYVFTEAPYHASLAAIGLAAVACVLTAFMFSGRLRFARDLLHRLGVGDTDITLDEIQELGEGGAWAHAAAKRLAGLESDVQRIRSALAAIPVPVIICDRKGNLQMASTNVMLGFATLDYGTADNDLQALLGRELADMVLERRSMSRERVLLPHTLAGIGPGAALLYATDLPDQNRMLLVLTEAPAEPVEQAGSAREHAPNAGS